MDPQALLQAVGAQLWALVDDTVVRLRDPLDLASLPFDGSVNGTPLQGRLLSAIQGGLPAGAGGLSDLLRDLLGDATQVKVHGWQPAGGGARGVAFVAVDAGERAVLALTPGGIDVVLTGRVRLAETSGPWKLDLSANGTWDARIVSGKPAAVQGAATGTVALTVEHTGPLTLGPVTIRTLSARLNADLVTAVPAVTLTVQGLRADLIPAELHGLFGGVAATEESDVTLHADRLHGLRFEGSAGVSVTLPARIDLPGLSMRGLTLALRLTDAGLHFALTTSITAQPPGLPLLVRLDDLGVDVPFTLAGDALGVLAEAIRADPPAGISLALKLPAVTGGGTVLHRPDGTYGGLLDLTLGTFHVQAAGVLRPEPFSLLLVLSFQFPPPGVQVGFGFALDAIGGIVGLNHRADADRLRALVADGHADRILFPDNALRDAAQVIDVLATSFPEAPGRFVIGPMVRITWGAGGMVSLSAAVVLDLPDPPRIVLLGRLLIALPNPAAPVIRLQASVFGLIEPAVPRVELLVSLAGSTIVGYPVSGEIYFLFQGGSNAEFVLSAGGFHPRYRRPPGVPQLKRLTMELGSGGFGLSAESYFAVTSNAVMFGAKAHLDAEIAGCGVEGWLGLDALFLFEPVFAFSVRVSAGVAVKAFGHRLAGIALDFTLEGPRPWHAFGSGSISVLFWDVSLDFDVRWGDPPAAAVTSGVDLPALLGEAFAAREAWTVERPAADRTGLVFTAEAQTRLARGTLTHPDSELRVSQRVIPLRERLERHQLDVLAPQVWTVSRAGLGVPGEVDGLPDISDRFVPGEHFTLTEEQKLSTPAFRAYQSGVGFDAEGVRLGPVLRVDDGYETGFRPDLSMGRQTTPGSGSFDLERQGWIPGPGERLDRWRSTAMTAVNL